MDKRIASMSSLNTDVSDLRITDPRTGSPAPSSASSSSAAASSQAGPKKLLKKSNPNMHTPSITASEALSSPPIALPIHPPPGPPPPNAMSPPSYSMPPPSHNRFSNPVQLSPNMGANGDTWLQPPPPLHISTIPEADATPGSRPQSRDGRNFSRPDSRPGSRPGSRDPSQVRNFSSFSSRAASPGTAPALQLDTKIKKRRSWLPGTSGQASTPTDGKPTNATAWIIAPGAKVPYDLGPLTSFLPVNELWDEQGDTLVYLHSDPSGPGASFRVNSACFSDSKKLVQTAHGQTRTLAHSRQASREFRDQSLGDGGGQGPAPLSEDGTMRTLLGQAPPRQDIHLCLPQRLHGEAGTVAITPNSNDAETLVTIRNLFAMLTGQPLVATARRSTLFSIFMHLSDVLYQYEFTNFDGSTLGEETTSRFSAYLNDFHIGDVRTSREQTIEALLLGERMRCLELYNEGYVHAVGKYPEIAAYNTPKTGQISAVTRKRLERSHLFLSTRLRGVRESLQDFDFPALWAGFANSTSSNEAKQIRFKAWKSSFLTMRKHVMDFYKSKYGHWPPKARSKKNNFEESGLNRILLKDVYQDLCDLYDVLADRSNLTTRQAGVPSNEKDDPSESLQRAMRRILGEYDRSVPPVQPAIPFDTPWLPSLSSSRRNFDALDSKKQKKENTKKIPDSEINTILMASYNRDLMKSTPFLQAFFAFERRLAHNKSIEDIADHRIGQWLFMYVVIQALPPVVIDAPGLKYVDGVEYFLFEFSKEAPPWMPQDRNRKTTWRIPGSEIMVDMPVSAVEHSLDAIYERSHCWQVAQQWAGSASVAAATTTSQYAIPDEELLPPVMPSVGHSRNNSRNASPDRRSSAGYGYTDANGNLNRFSGQSFADRRLSMGPGLEQLPLPPGMGVSPVSSRPTSSYDPSKNFNSILGLQDEVGKGGKKKK